MNRHRPFSLGGGNWSNCPTVVIWCSIAKRLSYRLPATGEGASRQLELFHHVIACEAGRLAVDCRRDIVALFQIKAGASMLSVVNAIRLQPRRLPSSSAIATTRLPIRARRRSSG